MDARPLESVTIAFELAALERLADPAAVFDQTTGWASHVGVVSDRPTHAITDFARRHGVDIGFHSGPRDLLASLPHVRQQPELDAERYVLIATSDLDRAAVRELGWELLSLDDAAAAGGWEVRDESDGGDEEASWL